MLFRAFRKYAFVAISLILISSVANAQNRPKVPELSLQKADLSYFAVGTNFNKFKSIDFYLVNSVGSTIAFTPATKAHTYGASFVYGTYITNHIKTEIRYGQGVQHDTLGQGSMDVNLGDWFNWYIGAAYPLIDYATPYFQFGLTFYNAEVTRYVTRRFVLGDGTNPDSVQPVIPSTTQMEEKLFADTFSTSWLVGVDFNVYKDLYWTWEYGRLLNDAGSGIKVYQLNSYFKFEF